MIFGAVDILSIDSLTCGIINLYYTWGDCNGESFNQKLKLLYIMQMLKENTDENHAMSANDIISALAKQGISAERKSIYDDIERLKLFGCDILSRRSEPKGYYLASRDFEIAELKLLVDAVQSSKSVNSQNRTALQPS